MSADNGIYILKTKRTRVYEVFRTLPNGEEIRGWGEHKDHFVYRVAHASAIDNFDYYKEHQLYNLGIYMKEVWGNSKVFTDFDQAHRFARDLESVVKKEVGTVEYGVSTIDASEFIFYGDM